MVDKVTKGDYLSEESHYKVVDFRGDTVVLQHLESNTSVNVSMSYIRELMHSAKEVLEEVKVTKEDKKDGTPGIRSIFEGIHGPEVFTVCFKKQDIPKTAKALQKEIERRVEEFVEAVEKAKSSKKGVAAVAKAHFESTIKEPILPYTPGEDRVLHGYKVQFESRDGRYQCKDLDLNGVRPVNINTIQWLIYKGVKYVVTE